MAPQSKCQPQLHIRLISSFPATSSAHDADADADAATSNSNASVPGAVATGGASAASVPGAAATAVDSSAVSMVTPPFSPPPISQRLQLLNDSVSTAIELLLLPLQLPLLLLLLSL